MKTATLFGIFIHPADAARAIAARPTWLIPLVIGCLISAVVAWSVVGITRVEQADLMKTSRFGKMMPPEALDKMAEDAQTLTMRQHILSGLVSPIVGFVLFQVLLYAAIVHGIARAMGGQGSFAGTLSLVSHARLIMALGALVAFPIMLAKHSVFTVSLSLAALFPSLGPGQFAYGFLTIFSVFGIWFLYVLATGLREIHQIPRNLAWITAGIPWCAFGLLQAAALTMM